MKLKDRLTSLVSNNIKVFKISDILLRIISIAFFISWIMKIKLPYVDGEAAFAGALIIAAGFNQLYKWLLDESEFSPAYALAFGYVEHFIEPTITQLINEGKIPILCIYKPEYLNDLSNENIDRVRGKINNNYYQVGEINLSLKQGRTRDVIVIELKKGEELYFDFPSTLKSLIPYIDYKIGTVANESDDDKKEKLGAELIKKFFNKLEERLKSKSLDRYVKTSADLDFEK